MTTILVTVSAMTQEINTTDLKARYQDLSDVQIPVEVTNNGQLHTGKGRAPALAEGLRRLADMVEARA